MSTRRDPNLALVLSFLIPGVGQLYAGRYLWAAFWLLFTPGFWVGTGGCLGWVCHLVSAWQAQQQAHQG